MKHTRRNNFHCKGHDELNMHITQKNISRYSPGNKVTDNHCHEVWQSMKEEMKELRGMVDNITKLLSVQMKSSSVKIKSDVSRFVNNKVESSKTVEEGGKHERTMNMVVHGSMKDICSRRSNQNSEELSIQKVTIDITQETKAKHIDDVLVELGYGEFLNRN